jgi:hypothetical protein
MLLNVAKNHTFGLITAIFLLVAGFAACGGGDKDRTPSDTFKEYIKASKKKDTTAMKILLSSATMKMHEQEAKAQNTTVDDIVKRETLVAPTQTNVDYRNEVINGDKASIQFKNAYGNWETLPFVREDSQWKIDKAGYADQVIQQMDESNRKIDEKINNSANIPTPNP